MKKTLPPNHPELATFYYNIGVVYDNMAEYSKAVSYCELAVDIGQRSLPTNHPNLQIYEKRLEMLKRKCK
jgi:tetratricopeptide (TPR) repeat protein